MATSRPYSVLGFGGNCASTFNNSGQTTSDFAGWHMSAGLRRRNSAEPTDRRGWLVRRRHLRIGARQDRRISTTLGDVTCDPRIRRWLPSEKTSDIAFRQRLPELGVLVLQRLYNHAASDVLERHKGVTKPVPPRKLKPNLGLRFHAALNLDTP